MAATVFVVVGCCSVWLPTASSAYYLSSSSSFSSLMLLIETNNRPPFCRSRRIQKPVIRKHQHQQQQQRQRPYFGAALFASWSSSKKSVSSSSSSGKGSGDDDDDDTLARRNDPLLWTSAPFSTTTTTTTTTTSSSDDGSIQKKKKKAPTSDDESSSSNDVVAAAANNDPLPPSQYLQSNMDHNKNHSSQQQIGKDEEDQEGNQDKIDNDNEVEDKYGEILADDDDDDDDDDILNAYSVGEITLTSFNMDLHNLAMDDPTKAEDAVHVMQDLYDAQQQQDHPNTRCSTTTQAAIRPDATCWTTVMDGYIQAGMLEEAQSVLDRMYDMMMTANNSNNSSNDDDDAVVVAPNDYSFTLMAQAWADDYKEDFAGTSAEKAEAVLRRMVEAAQAGMLQPASLSKHKQQRYPYLRPSNATTFYAVSANDNNTTNSSFGTTMTTTTTTSSSIVKVWSIVVEGWCKRTGFIRHALSRAQDLILEMENSTLVQPNVLTYTSYIGGLTRSRDRQMATKAEAVLERMAQHNVQPDMVAYTAVVNCWAKTGSRRERDIAASRALRLLGEMERLYISKQVYTAKPSLITYAAVISAIGNSLDQSSPQLAEDVIRRMNKLQESGMIANLRPVTSTYNAVIYALSRAPVSNRLKYAKRAEQLLEEMNQRAAENGEKHIQPDVRTWAAVLRAWARSRQADAAENTQRVLDKMEYRYKKGMSTVRPNFVCYTTVMGAWGRSRSKNALDKMEQILKRMEQGYEETLEADVRPNTVSYVTCIDAFVRRNEPDAAQRAQETVDRMMHYYAKGLGHVRPARLVFNVLIHAWSRSKQKDAAQKAEQIFQWMESQYEAGDNMLRPDEVSLCAVLNAWANHAENGGADRALQIWDHTANSGAAEKRGFHLTIAMANIVIKAIARSKQPDAVSKAERILLSIEENYRSGRSYLRPDVTTFSSVINACAYCVGDATTRAEALNTAIRTFRKLRETDDESPNNIVYGTLFKAIQNLMPVGVEREELVQDLFDQCCEGGFVDQFVLSQVRFASPQLYRDLVDGPCGLGGGPGSQTGIEAVLKNIPFEWSSNVVE